MVQSALMYDFEVKNSKKRVKSVQIKNCTTCKSLVMNYL